MNIRVDAVPENSKKSSPSPATNDEGEEEEERRARIDETVDEVVDASSSVVDKGFLSLKTKNLLSHGLKSLCGQ